MKINRSLELLIILAVVTGIGITGILVGNNYTVDLGRFSQNKGGVELTGGNFTVTSSVNTELGNTAMTGGDYMIEVDKVLEPSPGREAQATLDDAHVYPNPCRKYLGDNEINFTRLTQDANIKIYTISGELVTELIKPSVNLDEMAWDLKNDQGETVASGVYIYYIKSGGMSKKGKLIIIK